MASLNWHGTHNKLDLCMQVLGTQLHTVSISFATLTPSRLKIHAQSIQYNTVRVADTLSVRRRKKPPARPTDSCTDSCRDTRRVHEAKIFVSHVDDAIGCSRDWPSTRGTLIWSGTFSSYGAIYKFFSLYLGLILGHSYVSLGYRNGLALCIPSIHYRRLTMLPLSISATLSLPVPFS